MQELNSGCYLVKDNKAISQPYNILDKSGAIRLVSKDFSKIDIERFNGCAITVSNTPLNLSIEFYCLDCSICKHVQKCNLDLKFKTMEA